MSPDRGLLDLRQLLPEDLVPELSSCHEISSCLGGVLKGNGL